jgi:GTP cyclohydrolase I
MYDVTYGELNRLINNLRTAVLLHFYGDPYFKPGAPLLEAHIKTLSCYPVARGGVPVALALMGTGPFTMAETFAEADFVVDDLIDSGATLVKYNTKPFFALIDKRPEGNPHHGKWIVFPWEGSSVGSFEDNIRRTLQFVGEDTTREGLAETPTRVAKAWQFWCKGYNENPADILKVFEDGAKDVDELVLVRDIPFYTHCEHHMAPFFGRATVGYIPDGRIIGLSKINRLVDCFARRLQVQERLTTQIADALMDHLKPRGVGVILNARHLCMESRGVCQQGHSTTTSALRGILLEGEPRKEFLHLAK